MAGPPVVVGRAPWVAGGLVWVMRFIIRRWAGLGNMAYYVLRTAYCVRSGQQAADSGIVTSYQLPVTSYQLPVASCQLPAADRTFSSFILHPSAFSLCLLSPCHPLASFPTMPGVSSTHTIHVNLDPAP